MQFDYIVAVDSKFGIAKNGDLPWKGTSAGNEDMAFFKQRTCKPGTAVIMGRVTWESIPAKYTPLKGRINIVISSSYTGGVTIHGGMTDSPIVYVDSFDAALNWCAKAKASSAYGLYRCMVIGGAQVYKEAFASPWLRTGYVTKFNADYDCDVTLPAEILTSGKVLKCKSSNYANYYTVSYANIEEEAFQELLARLTNAPLRPNRTGIPTRGLFHEVLKFKLYDPLRGNIMPLITTKRVPWASVYHENMWFLSGKCTTTDYLKKHNVKIWDGNSSREFLDKYKLEHYREGEVGPIYGYQWRSFNAPYWSESEQEEFNTKVVTLKRKPSNFDNDRLASGIDQIVDVIYALKTNPWDRRMIVTAWNPAQIPDMALPPCHYAFQFHVDPDETGAPKYLNCVMNMRSADCFLGVPFNIASYALITHIIAYIVNLTPGVLSISMTDCHLYENAMTATRTLLSRNPRRFPTIKFSDKITNTKNINIDNFVNDFNINDYIIENYQPHAFIKCDMAI